MLHGVADERLHTEAVSHLGVVVDMLLVVEVGIHVAHEELVHVVVVAGVVPPPSHLASEPFAHDGGILVVGHRPDVLAGNVYHRLLWRGVQRMEEPAGLLLAHPRVGVELRHVVERLHGVGRCRALAVPPLVHELLQRGKPPRADVEARRVVGHAAVVDEHAKLAHAELVHRLILLHYLVEHAVALGVEEGGTRVDGPDEVDLVGGGHLCHVPHHVLRHHADLLLFRRDGERIRLLPELRVVKVRLGSIHV